MEPLEDRRVLSTVPGWAFDVGGVDFDRINDVAVDSDGDVYVTGEFTGTVDFDPQGSTAGSLNILSTDGSSDIFVAAYSAAGSLKWVNQYGGVGDDDGRAITTHGTSIYVAGSDREGSAASDGVEAAFLVKIDAVTGVEQALNWNPVGDAEVEGIAVDADGNIYVTGQFDTAIDFNGDGNTDLQPSLTREQYIVKLDAAGDLLWAQQTGNRWSFSVAADNLGNVYISGLNWDGNNNDTFGGLPVNGGRAVVAQLDGGTGAFKWVKAFGGDGYDEATSVATDGTGVYVTGRFEGVFSFDGGSNLFSADGRGDAFVLKVSDNGVLDWAQQLDSDTYSHGQEVVVDADGYVYYTGWLEGTAIPTPGFTLTSSGSTDTFFAKLDATDGTMLSAVRAGAADNEGAYGMAVDANGNIYTAGIFRGTSEFLSGDVLNSEGDYDMFVWKIGESLISVNPTSAPITTEDGDAATFTVVLTEQPTDDVTITLRSSDLTEGNIQGADANGELTLTFTAADYDSPQIVTVVGVDDSDPLDVNEPYDGDQVYQIDLLAATSADPKFDGFDAGKVLIVNVDNDTVDATFSNNTPVQLNDAKGKSVGVTTSTIDITEAGAILDLTVQLNITHTYDEDLAVHLISPDGTRVELFSALGGSGDNFTNTVFDDAAVASINSATAPFQGIYQPSESLSAFESANNSADNLSGTWTLEILDSNRFDTGTLNSWSITVLYAPVEVPNSPPTAADDVESTNIDTSVVIEFNDLLANDEDPDGDTLSVTSVGGASNGTVTNNGDGTVTYDPDPGYIGTDSFTYTIADGSGATDTASVTVTVIDPSAEQTYSSTDTPLTIQDPHKKQGYRTLTSEIDIGTIGAIASLSIDLDIDHAEEANLEVKLQSSSGDVVTLDYIDGAWVLDPSLFLGTELSGTWTLSITDTVSDRVTGTLNSWSLTASVESAAALDAAMAEFALNDGLLD